MIHRGPYDRDSQRDVHRAFEIQKLHRNVALVVVHGHHQVIGAAPRLQEDGVAGMRTAALDSLGAGRLDGGNDELLVFLAEQPVLARMRVQTADGDAGLVEPEQPHRLAAQLDGAHDAIGAQIAGLAQRHVRAHVNGGEPLAGQQHARLGGAAELRDVFGVPGERAARKRDRLLVQRRRDHGIRRSAQAHFGGESNVLHRGLAAARVQPAE